MARATRALGGTAGVGQVTFVRKSEHFLVDVTLRFRLRSAAAQVRRAGKLPDRQLGIRDVPPWVLRVADESTKKGEH